MINVEESQWWNLEKIREWQMERFRMLIDFVKGNGPPFYKDYLDSHNLCSTDFNTIDDLQKLPIIEKKEMRIIISQVDTSKFKNVYLNITGGSTGKALRYYVSREVFVIGYKCRNRGFGWAGCRFEDDLLTQIDKMIYMGGGSIVKNLGITGNVLTLPGKDMGEDLAVDFYNRIVKFDAKYLRTYPSIASVFIKFMKKLGKTVHFDSIITTSEMLFPYQKSAIEEFFGGKVYNEYGAYDGGVGAFECEKGNMHLQIERGIVEFINDKGEQCKEGEVGRIITTDLWNFVNPFIRYEVGDMGSFSNKICECRRGLPLLSSLQGKIRDIVTTKSGEYLSYISVANMVEDFLDLSSLMEWQFIQKTLDYFILNIVAENSTQEDIDIMLKCLKEKLGDDVKIDINFVDKIQRSPNDKWRAVISEVPFNF